MSPGSSTESYPAFAHIGLSKNPGKNLNQVTCPDRESNPGHLVSQPDALTVTPQVWTANTDKFISGIVPGPSQWFFHFGEKIVIAWIISGEYGGCSSSPRFPYALEVGTRLGMGPGSIRQNGLSASDSEYYYPAICRSWTIITSIGHKMGQFQNVIEAVLVQVIQGLGQRQQRGFGGQKSTQN
ncbi:hypothetical protein ANN_02250 [Periplaneta americana]|uniref:Per a allergen n=1 Tax=Periplaneta americana TaxID=6978 RepID=A0ABQ8TVR0_PERAM|nr:hypothetical protein ANN_02250 [Periplaneta americana]